MLVQSFELHSIMLDSGLTDLNEKKLVHSAGKKTLFVALGYRNERLHLEG
jgi:hypothetical protein